MAGNLDTHRDASRAAVHAQFALPAIVYTLEGALVGNAKVRLHLADSRAFGDLDREGYAFAIEGKTLLVFDSEEFKPGDGLKVDFGRGRVYAIDHVIDKTDRTRYPRCIASETTL